MKPVLYLLVTSRSGLVGDLGVAWRELEMVRGEGRWEENLERWGRHTMARSRGLY